MSAVSDADAEVVEPRITVEDVKQRAAAVRDLAKSEAKRTANEVLHERATQTIIIGVVAVAALASFAYFLGARRCQRQLPPPAQY
jgi:GH24 family phage-related lysozyme (muramidase)